MTFEVGRLSAALTLDGVEQTNRGLDSVGTKFKQTGKIAEDSTQGLASSIRRAATQSTSDLNLIGTGFMKAGLAATAAAGIAVTKWANFDQAMSNVNAATHETSENMELLKQASLDAGARTAFSATEAANAVEELAKAGISTRDILSGGLDGALDLAAAGGLGVADAAGIAATALKTFGLRGKDMAHVADLLAAGAGKAMGDVSDLSAALNQSSMVAKASGLSIEETTAALSAFASQGLLGSDAGTSFKTMLMSLQGPTGEAKARMDELGISAYDSQGRFVGLASFAGKLKNALAGMSEEQRQATLKTIFGSDAIRAATVLYSEGEEGIRNWIKAVDDQGYAAETAAARLDNLKGDLEALGGAIDTALISTGSAANDILREMVQWVTSAVNAYNDLPEPVQGLTMGVGLLAAGVGVLGGAFMLGTIKVAEYNAALKQLGITGANTQAALAGISPALIAIAAVPIAANIVDWIDSLHDSKTAADELTRSLKKTGDVSTELVSGLGGKDILGNLNTDLAVDKLRALDTAVGNMQATWENSMLGKAMSLPVFGTDSGVGDAAKQIEELDTALTSLAQGGNLDAAARGYEQFAAMAKDAGWSNEKIAEALPGYTAALEDASVAAEEAADSEEAAARAAAEHESALAELSGQAQSTEVDISGLADTIRGFGSTTLDAREANRRFQEAIDNMTQSVEKNGLTLDISTEKGRQNEEALDAIAQRAKEVAASTLEQTGSQEAANQAIADGRQKLIEVLAQFGIVGQAAEDYADNLGLIPGNIYTAAHLNTTSAVSAIRSFIDSYDGKTITIYGQMAFKDGVNASALLNRANGGIDTADGRHFAGGGFASGIYRGVMGGIPKMGVDGVPHLFAERHLGVDWETYISSRASKERNAALLMETARRIGFPVIPVSALRGVRAFADGGYVARTSTPVAPVEAPRGPITIPVYGHRGMNVDDLAEAVWQKIEGRL